MNLTYDITRCDGGDRPSKNQCRRYTDRRTAGEYTSRAALWVRREAGADACDMIMPTIDRSSTFEANDSTNQGASA